MSVIPNASYYIYDRHQSCTVNSSPALLPSGWTGEQKVTFYTFDGVPILVRDGSFQKDELCLDRKTPKRRPRFSKRIWWPAIPIGGGFTKGVPGEFILFYDQRGVCIYYTRFPYDGTDLDLSQVIELAPDYSLRNRVTQKGFDCCLL
jgi:hypothetical protein